jgi:hypothetical protein
VLALVVAVAVPAFLLRVLLGQTVYWLLAALVATVVAGLVVVRALHLARQLLLEPLEQAVAVAAHSTPQIPQARLVPQVHIGHRHPIARRLVPVAVLVARQMLVLLLPVPVFMAAAAEALYRVLQR